MAGRPLRMLDLFAGLGGASQAMRAAGWEVVTVDNDPTFGCDVTADLTDWSPTLRGWDVGPAYDLVWASPPCQEFSRHGMPWLRAKNPPPPDMTLAKAARRIIAEVQPTWWVVENVRGAVPFFRPLFGDVRQAFHGLHLWGRFPPLVADVKPWKEKLPGTAVSRRAKVPLAVSEALRLACEATLFARPTA